MWAIRKPTSVGVKNSPRALAGTFREFTEKVLVGAAQKVGLHVGQAQAVAGVGEGLDDGSEAGRVEVAFAVALRSEVHEVYDARKGGVVTERRLARPSSGARRCRGAACCGLGCQGSQSWASRPLTTPHRASGGR